MTNDLNDCKMNKHKWYCFEAEGKKFKKIIAHNVQGFAMVGLRSTNVQPLHKSQIVVKMFN